MRNKTTPNYLNLNLKRYKKKPEFNYKNLCKCNFSVLYDVKNIHKFFTLFTAKLKITSSKSKVCQVRFSHSKCLAAIECKINVPN